MRPVAYVRPANVESACMLVGTEPGAAFIGGGTEILNWLKDGLDEPDLLVDLADLDLSAIETSTNGIRLGASTTMSAAAAHADVRSEFPVLAQALEAGASPQLRNMATVGGNLMQRTRCAYFREPSFPCNKRNPGSGCAAREGDHGMHAILGSTDDCIAVHPSDMAVALLALDASVTMQGQDGRRTIAIDDFYRGTGDDPRQETTLRLGELIVDIELRSSPRARHSCYLKVRERGSFAFALVSVAAAIEIVDGVVRTARIALGGVAHRPWRARGTENALVGRPLTADSMRDAAAAAIQNATPLPGNRYKVALVRGAVTRVLTEIGEGTP